MEQHGPKPRANNTDFILWFVIIWIFPTLKVWALNELNKDRITANLRLSFFPKRWIGWNWAKENSNKQNFQLTQTNKQTNKFPFFLSPLLSRSPCSVKEFAIFLARTVAKRTNPGTRQQIVENGTGNEWCARASIQKIYIEKEKIKEK